MKQISVSWHTLADFALPALIACLPFPMIILIVGACGLTAIIRVGHTYTPCYGLSRLQASLDDLGEAFKTASENNLLLDIIFANIVKGQLIW